jgi:hypothetical protein
LIGAVYIKVFRYPHIQKRQRIVQATNWLLRPVLCSPKACFRRCLTMRRKWGPPLYMKHVCCWWRGKCSKSTGKSFTNKRW